jgi:hypothetical protein
VSSAASEEVPTALRKHFASHNRRVIFLAIFTLVFAIAAWALAYFILHWLTLLAMTVFIDIDASPPPDFAVVFILSGLALVALVLITHRLHPIERLSDRKRWWQIAGDLILAVPRATASIWGTISAYQFLDERELELAWRLMKRIHEQRRLSIFSVPQEIAGERDRNRILVALQLTDLVEVHTIGSEIRLLLREDGRRICAPRVRLNLPR